jgi:hypothetical protein
MDAQREGRFSYFKNLGQKDLARKEILARDCKALRENHYPVWSSDWLWSKASAHLVNRAPTVLGFLGIRRLGRHQSATLDKPGS